MCEICSDLERILNPSSMKNFVAYMYFQEYTNFSFAASDRALKLVIWASQANCKWQRPHPCFDLKVSFTTNHSMRMKWVIRMFMYLMDKQVGII